MPAAAAIQDADDGPHWTIDGCFEPVTFACRGPAAACTTNDDGPDLRCGRDEGSWACGDWWACE